MNTVHHGNDDDDDEDDETGTVIPMGEKVGKKKKKGCMHGWLDTQSEHRFPAPSSRL